MSRSCCGACTTALQAKEGCNDFQLVQDMLQRVRQINFMPEEIRNNLLEFKVDGHRLGKVSRQTAEILCLAPNTVFQVECSTPDRDRKPFLTLSRQAGSTCASRTTAVARVMEYLRDEGVVKGWRDEAYPVAESFYLPPVFTVERAASNLLGVLEYGVHINGIVRTEEDHAPLMWMARRSATKSKFPGMLDHIAAGGQPVGLGLIENSIKECWEEAGIPQVLAQDGLRPASVISYETYSPYNDRITRCVLFALDLELPPDFTPKALDGEVDEFFLWNLDQVKEAMEPDYPDPIKPNCYPIIIDYLIREGHVSPEAPGYLDIIRELRSGDCY